jgi:hypothetical protein
LWQPSKRSTYYFLGIMKKRYEVAGDDMMQWEPVCHKIEWQWHCVLRDVLRNGSSGLHI